MIDSLLLLIHEFALIDSEKAYSASFKSQVWFYAVGIIGGDSILILRTCAIWGNNIKIAIWLSILWGMIAMPGAYAVNRYTASLQFQKSQVPGVIKGYFVSNSDDIIFVSYATLVVFETVVLLLTLWKINKQHDKSVLYRVLYWDSLMFYICLFVISMANILTLILAPAVMKPIMIQLHRILHSVVLGRIVLNIRGAMNSRKTSVDDALSTFMLGESFCTQVDNHRPAVPSGDQYLLE